MGFDLLGESDASLACRCLKTAKPSDVEQSQKIAQIATSLFCLGVRFTRWDNSERSHISNRPTTGTSTLLNDVAKSSVVLDRELDEEKIESPSGPRIRCPLCGWSPREEDLWSCTCGHMWNTFDTGGVCPACLHQWPSTQCLSCKQWS